jgi:hypothetical protein
MRTLRRTRALLFHDSFRVLIHSPWPELTTNLLTQHPTLCKGLPLVTMKAIADYLRHFPSPSGSQKPRTAVGVVPKGSPAPLHPPNTVPKSSTSKTTIGQKASTTPTSSTARRRTQKSSTPSQPLSTTDPKHGTPSQPQPVPRTFLVPSHFTQTRLSPSTSQKAPDLRPLD